jgi:hypothetical protein
MKTEAVTTFPLSWEQVFWTARPRLPGGLLHPSTYYALTDFRLVVRRRHTIVQELALDDIDGVRLTQSWLQKMAGTSTVEVFSRRDGRALTIVNIREGPQLALILQLRATELIDDAEFLRTALGPEAAPLLKPNRSLAAAATLAFGLAFGVIALARHDTLPPVRYAADDPISPGGTRAPHAEIVAFMEHQVMPFARRVLAPLEGGADNVSCETCHGADAAARSWHMPGVRALPEPEFRAFGLERAGFFLDPQIRNAVYGYLAEEDKQSTAGYMRRVVMPGMAALMHRPAYDFAKSYGYNRSIAAVGCYHCHLVN